MMARWTFRGVGSLALLIAVASLVLGAYRGMPALVGGVITAAIYGAIGIGLWRVREGAWMAVILVLGLVCAVELAVALGRRDWMLLLGAAFNAAIIAVLVWAGRQLPEPQVPSASASEGSA